MAETWLINESLNLISLSTSINFTSNNESYTLFDIRTNNLFYNDNNVYLGRFVDWVDQAYRAVTFSTAPTGDLLTWLQANAVKQEEPTPEITDLTGYTWVGNETIDLHSISKQPVSESNVDWVSVNFISNNEQYTKIRIGSTNGFLWNILAYNNNDMIYWLGQGGWKNENYRTIKITGGTDATNSELIAWLEANGTLTPQPQPSNTIKIGSSDVNIMIGNTQVDKVYIGSNVVWEKAEPTPTGYTLNISGTTSYVWYSGGSGGNKITIDGVTASVTHTGVTENIPHIFNNVENEIAIEAIPRSAASIVRTPCIQIISGSGTYRFVADGSEVKTGSFEPNMYLNNGTDYVSQGKTYFLYLTLSQDTEIKLCYMDD